MDENNENVTMKALKNSVEELFNSAKCSAEYKAVLAELLAQRWRTISDAQINLQLSQMSGKENKNVTSETGHKN